MTAGDPISEHEQGNFISAAFKTQELASTDHTTHKPSTTVEYTFDDNQKLAISMVKDYTKNSYKNL